MFFVDEVRGHRAEIAGEEARHLRKVLRAEVGQKYEISDNRSLYLAEVDSLGKDLISFQVLERLEPSRPPLRLIALVSLIKFDRLEWILEKATELGVETISPVEAERSELGLERAAQKRLERWKRIVQESSQQSRRVTMPKVTGPLLFEEAVEVEADLRLFLEENRGAMPLWNQLPAGRRQEDKVAILVGPEGGWADRERTAAVTAGWNPVSLGPQILRAETAAIAALSVLSSAWQALP